MQDQLPNAESPLPQQGLDFVEIYRAKNLPQAHMIRIALEEAGIAAQIEGEVLQSAAGELVGWATAPRILVDRSQIDSARPIIDECDIDTAREPVEEENVETTRCLACGALMVETEPKCRTCGWSYQGEQ
jgi:hypothetical protein